MKQEKKNVIDIPLTEQGTAGISSIRKLNWTVECPTSVSILWDICTILLISMDHAHQQKHQIKAATLIL